VFAPRGHHISYVRWPKDTTQPPEVGVAELGDTGVSLTALTSGEYFALIGADGAHYYVTVADEPRLRMHRRDFTSGSDVVFATGPVSGDCGPPELFGSNASALLLRCASDPNVAAQTLVAYRIFVEGSHPTVPLSDPMGALTEWAVARDGSHAVFGYTNYDTFVTRVETTDAQGAARVARGTFESIAELGVVGARHTYYAAGGNVEFVAADDADMLHDVNIALPGEVYGGCMLGTGATDKLEDRTVFAGHGGTHLIYVDLSSVDAKRVAQSSTPVATDPSLLFSCPIASADGRMLVYVVSGDEGAEIYLVSWSGVTPEAPRLAFRTREPFGHIAHVAP
jgi:hypothetical protein